MNTQQITEAIDTLPAMIRIPHDSLTLWQMGHDHAFNTAMQWGGIGVFFVAVAFIMFSMIRK